MKTGSEVKAAVLANLKQPRTTYDVLICAGRQGMIGTALQTYKSLMGSNPLNAAPEIKSAYALSHHLTLYPRLWYWKRETTPGLVSGEWNNVGKVSLFRDEALAARPRSPEVLLASALWQYHQDVGGRIKALRLVEQALRYAPKWADLHFWHSRMLMGRAVAYPSDQLKKAMPRYSRLSLQAISKAEKLDPTFRKECLIDRSTALYELGKTREALAAYDAYARYRPAWMNLRSSKETRKYLVAAAAKQRG